MHMWSDSSDKAHQIARLKTKVSSSRPASATGLRRTSAMSRFASEPLVTPPVDRSLGGNENHVNLDILLGLDYIDPEAKAFYTGKQTDRPASNTIPDSDRTPATFDLSITSRFKALRTSSEPAASSSQTPRIPSSTPQHRSHTPTKSTTTSEASLLDMPSTPSSPFSLPPELLDVE